MIPVATLTTERLILRDWRDDDLPAFRSLNLDREVRRYFTGLLTPFESDASAQRIRRFLSEHGWGLWAVEERGGAPFLGFVGLNQPDFAPFQQSVEVGWRLSRNAWGHGYATEAARAAVAHAFVALGLAELVAFTVPSNVPSRRVMDRLGMVQDEAGTFEHPRIAEGHPLRAHVLYRLSHERWSHSLRASMTPFVKGEREPSGTSE